MRELMHELNLCPICGEPVYKEIDDRFLLAQDRPTYQNIWAHKSCLITNGGLNFFEGNVLEVVNDNKKN